MLIGSPIGPLRREPPVAQERLKVARESLRSDAPSAVREHAASTLCQFGACDEAVPHLYDEHPRVRGNALVGLAVHGGPRFLTQLTTLLRDEEPWVRAEAHRRLGLLAEGVDPEQLAAGLEDSDWDVRLKAVEGLVAFGDVRFAEHIAGRLEDPHPDVLVQAALGLGTWLATDYHSQLQLRLEDERDEVRGAALGALLRMSRDDDLWAHFAVSSWESQQVALRHLATCGFTGDADPLRRLAKHGEQQQARMATAVLASMGATEPQHAPVQVQTADPSELIAALASPELPVTRWEAVQALWSVDATPELAAALAKALASPHTEVRADALVLATLRGESVPLDAALASDDEVLRAVGATCALERDGPDARLLPYFQELASTGRSISVRTAGVCGQLRMGALSLDEQRIQLHRAMLRRDESAYDIADAFAHVRHGSRVAELRSYGTWRRLQRLRCRDARLSFLVERESCRVLPLKQVLAIWQRELAT